MIKVAKNACFKHTTMYFNERECLHKKKMSKRLRRPAAADNRSQLVKLVEAWESFDPVARNAHDAGRYLYHRMFVERSMLDIRDHRRVAQLAWAMYCMRFKIKGKTKNDTVVAAEDQGDD